MNLNPLDTLLDKLSSGDPSAAEQVFRTYEPYLRMVVRRQLPGRLRAKFDSVDVVQSVWADVLEGFLSRPHEAIERLGAVDDPVIGIYAHWVYGPHTTEGVVGKDNPLDTIVLRWLARVPRLQTDRILAGRYTTSEECRAALERHMLTLKSINDSWSADDFTRDGDTGTIHYNPRGLVYARAELSCAEQR